jgi:hypothetical protein
MHRPSVAAVSFDELLRPGAAKWSEKHDQKLTHPIPNPGLHFEESWFAMLLIAFISSWLLLSENFTSRRAKPALHKGSGLIAIMFLPAAQILL